MSVRLMVLMLSVPMLSACGGGSTSPRSTTPAPLALEGSGRTPEDPVLACHVGPDRSDYAYIASYVCPDGTMPLAGDPGRGASARLGNIGQGADGHVIDEYEVPCRPGVRIYVDAYHCAEGVEDEIDMSDLSPEALQSIAANARAIEGSLDSRAMSFREGLVDFFMQTQQVHLVVCQALWDRIATDEYQFAQLVRSQFVASLGAGVIETSDGPGDRLRNNVLAVEGILHLYNAMLEEAGQVAAFAPLDEFRAAAAAGQLPALVESILANCDAPPATVMQMSTDGQNVWPPTGPGCERLVRCCESNGLVRDGGAVSDQGGGMMCLLGAAAGCEAALNHLTQVENVPCAP